MSAPRPVWHVAADVDAWAGAVAAATVDTLRRAIAADGNASLLVSGGTTPVPVFAALATAALDWPRVEVRLVDERWLPPEHPASNGLLVRTTLLQGRAAAARFRPLARADGDRDRAVAEANTTFPPAPTLALLGMGDDGHTASLFPGAAGLDAALVDPGPYVALDAIGCAGAHAWPQRITLTPMALARVGTRRLLIRGERKRELFERALADGDPRRWPVLVAVHAAGTPLEVYWCP